MSKKFSNEAAFLKTKYANTSFNFIVKSSLITYFILSIVFLFLYLISSRKLGTNKTIAFIFFQGTPLVRKPSIIIYWPFPLDNALAFLLTITLALIMALLLMRQVLFLIPLDEKNPTSSLKHLIMPQFGKNDHAEFNVEKNAQKNHFLLGLTSLVLYTVTYLTFMATTLQGLVASTTTNDLVLLVLGIGGGLILSILVGIVGVLEGIGKRLGGVGFISFFGVMTIFVAFLEWILSGNVTYGNLPLSLTGIGIIGGGVGFLAGVIILERIILSKLGVNNGSREQKKSPS